MGENSPNLVTLVARLTDECLLSAFIAPRRRKGLHEMSDNHMWPVSSATGLGQFSTLGQLLTLGIKKNPNKNLHFFGLLVSKATVLN
jgi:hypothetical protein